MLKVSGDDEALYLLRQLAASLGPQAFDPFLDRDAGEQDLDGFDV